MPRNTNSGPSDVQEARIALGTRLRELRRRAGLSGKQLAESLAWVPSKVSKIENGRQTPTEDDVRSWAGATGGDEEVGGLVATLHTMEERHAEWRRLLSGGMRPAQDKMATKEAQIRFFRVSTPTSSRGCSRCPSTRERA